MTALRPPFRQATLADAAVLAELVNHAGEGMPLYLWERMAGPGETAWDVGRKRAAREEGGFSYRNAVVIEHDGTCAGALIGYAIAAEAVPIGSDMPPMFVPLQELENLAPSTWYVNVLAVLPQARNRKLGSALLELADETGRAQGLRGMSVIVSDTNAGARRLYERHGYRLAGTRTKVKEGWENDGLEWVLLTKEL
jgi:ribosomal protein S18 acetylase RimI-like enzyme